MQNLKRALREATSPTNIRRDLALMNRFQRVYMVDHGSDGLGVCLYGWLFIIWMDEFDYRPCLGILFDYVGQWSFDELLLGIVDERYLAINVDSQSLGWWYFEPRILLCDAIRGDGGVVQAIITTSWSQPNSGEAYRSEDDGLPSRRGSCCLRLRRRLTVIKFTWTHLNYHLGCWPKFWQRTATCHNGLCGYLLTPWACYFGGIKFRQAVLVHWWCLSWWLWKLSMPSTACTCGQKQPNIKINYDRLATFCCQSFLIWRTKRTVVICAPAFIINQSCALTFKRWVINLLHVISDESRRITWTQSSKSPVMWGWSENTQGALPEHNLIQWSC